MYPYYIKPISANRSAIKCTSSCNSWIHATCAGLSTADLARFDRELKKSGEQSICYICNAAAVQQTRSSDTELADVKLEWIERFLQKHFNTLESKLMAALASCTDSIIKLESEIQTLETLNTNLKCKLDNNVTLKT